MCEMFPYIVPVPLSVLFLKKKKINKVENEVERYFSKLY